MPLVDPSRTVASMSKAEKNIRFGVARGLTQIAKAAQADVRAGMSIKFDRPTPFTLNAVAVTPATRDTLAATVLVKDIQAKYLLIEETGGQREPKQGSPINLPVGQRTNAYGNIPQGAISRAKAKTGTFAVGRGSRLLPGIYQRVMVGRGKLRQARLKLLVAFEKVASYRPRFGFRQTVEGTVKRAGVATLEASVRDALRSQW